MSLANTSQPILPMLLVASVSRTETFSAQRVWLDHFSLGPSIPSPTAKIAEKSREENERVRLLFAEKAKTPCGHHLTRSDPTRPI